MNDCCCDTALIEVVDCVVYELDDFVSTLLSVCCLVVDIIEAIH